MKICKHCMEEMKSRGEVVYVNYDEMMSIEEAEEMEIACEWCGEYDDLYEVKLDHPWG